MIKYKIGCTDIFYSENPILLLRWLKKDNDLKTFVTYKNEIPIPKNIKRFRIIYIKLNHICKDYIEYKGIKNIVNIIN